MSKRDPLPVGERLLAQFETLCPAFEALEKPALLGKTLPAEESLLTLYRGEGGIKRKHHLTSGAVLAWEYASNQLIAALS